MRPDYYPKMWFGTQERMQWIDAPLSGADIGKGSWGVDGEYINGGGYVRNARNSHNVYHFNWRRTSSRRSAQIMQNYRDGVYGDGLIYFVDPLTYDTNILPKSWAYPAITAGQSVNPFYRGLILPSVSTPSNSQGLPVRGIRFENVPSAIPNANKSVYLPAPPGYRIAIRIWATRSNSTPQFRATRVLANGNSASPSTVGIFDPSDTTLNSAVLTQDGDRGVHLHFPTHTGAGQNLQFFGARAWLFKTGSASTMPTPEWFGGQGHSGCKFVGNPTYIEHTSVDGGQIEYGAIFKEVGSWL